jgi:ribosomal protein L11 methyltransferase
MQAGMHILDQGAGSGILSLAAARLGAGQVVPVDVSEVAVHAARENAVRNGLDTLITALPGSAVPGTDEWSAAHLPLPEELPRTYDLVVANIIANVIIALASQLAEVLVPGGPLIASGIIREREEEVRAALQAAGFSIERAERRDEWVALVARRS